MAVDDPRVRVRSELEQVGLSMESASWIVDDRPPGGWGDLVTREHLHFELAALRAEFRTELQIQIGSVRDEIAGLATELRGEIGSVRGEIGSVRGEIADVRIEIAGLAAQLRAEMRDQTRWLTGVLVATMGVVATASAAAAMLAGAI